MNHHNQYSRSQNRSFAYQNSPHLDPNLNNNQSANNNPFVRRPNAISDPATQNTSTTFNRASTAIGDILKSVGYDVKNTANMSSATENQMNSFLSLNAPSLTPHSSTNSNHNRMAMPPLQPPPMPAMPMPPAAPPMFLPPPTSMPPFVAPSMYPMPPSIPVTTGHTNSLLPTPPVRADPSMLRSTKRSVDNYERYSPPPSRQKSLSPLSKRMLTDTSRSKRCHRNDLDYYSPERSYEKSRRRNDYYSPEQSPRHSGSGSGRERRSSRHLRHSRSRSPNREERKNVENLKFVNHQLAEQVACDKAIISDLRNRIYALEEVEKKKSEGKECKERDDVEYIYKESPVYWCGNCPELSTSLLRALDHLTSSSHSVNIKNKPCPWKKATKKHVIRKRINAGNAEGFEFMRHVPSAFHCDLCLCFLGDMEEADKHLKSYMHNREFYKYKLRHPDYMKKFNEKKTARMYEKSKTDEEQIMIQEEDEVVDNLDTKVDSSTDIKKMSHQDIALAAEVINDGDELNNKNGEAEVEEQTPDIEFQKKNFVDISSDEEFDVISTTKSNDSNNESLLTDPSSSTPVVLNLVLEPQPVVPLGLPRKMVRAKAKSQADNKSEPKTSQTNSPSSQSNPELKEIYSIEAEKDSGNMNDLDLEIVDECV